MAKFLKRKYSSSIMLLAVAAAVAVTGAVVYFSIVSSQNQTTGESQASAYNCSNLCRSMGLRNNSNCITTCEKVKTGESTCGDLCGLARTQSGKMICQSQCGKISPKSDLEQWCSQVDCWTVRSGGQSRGCSTVCTQVNEGTYTCNQGCDAVYPAVNGLPTQDNKKCKVYCPDWIMPSPSPSTEP